ncbi:MAG: hypothetical protein IJX78_07165 [Bacilli bacterium]|nr:hypothetical protein [Bacilli bacterium]
MKKFNIPLKLKIIIGLFLCGILIGMIVHNDLITITYLENISKIKMFINTFTINIWIFFIIWLLGNHYLGIGFILIITFLKGYIEGQTIISFLKLVDNLKIINLISFVVYWLFMIPLFIWLVNKEAVLNKSKDDKTIYLVLIITALFSLIIALIN